MAAYIATTLANSPQAIVANFEDNLGPLNGAKVVARAWVDPDYKARLLADLVVAHERLW